MVNTDSSTAAGQDVVQYEDKPKRTLWTGFLSFIWDSDSHLKSPEERRLLFKLDCAMLPCLCLGFFCKYLDQNNIT
jgi:ACS family pantothenate transporter-like MFS transporter